MSSNQEEKARTTSKAEPWERITPFVVVTPADFKEKLNDKRSTSRPL